MTKLVEVLLGISAPSERILLEGIGFLDPTLNDSQKASVKFALESPEIACIHGPPGIIVIPPRTNKFDLTSVPQVLGRRIL